MPNLFADKRKRCVAAIHCGRKGLEIKIIKNLIKIFNNKGCSKDDLLVAIGPSISKRNYLIDSKTLKNFYKHIADKESITCLEYERILFAYLGCSSMDCLPYAVLSNRQAFLGK